MLLYYYYYCINVYDWFITFMFCMNAVINYLYFYLFDLPPHLIIIIVLAINYSSTSN